MAATAATALEARRDDRQQPMNVQADHQSGGLGDDDAVVLTGNVQIVQGTLRIHAATATVERRAGELSRIILVGTPVRMHQIMETGEPMDATATRVTYSPDNEILLLTGNAHVAQPRGELRAEVIRYNLDTGDIDSGGDGNRIHMTIQPQARPATN